MTIFCKFECIEQLVRGRHKLAYQCEMKAFLWYLIARFQIYLADDLQSTEHFRH